MEIKKLQENYNKHIKIIKHYITGGRKALCLQMLEDFGEERYALAPFNAKEWTCGSYNGGYVHTINKIVEYCIKYSQFLKKSFNIVPEYTQEQLAFAALFHALGKVGTKTTPYLIAQKEDWRKEKLKENYAYNEELPYMKIVDRSLLNLQEAGILVDELEYLAILLSEGFFEPANEKYLVNKGEHTKVRNNIVYVLQHACSISYYGDFEDKS